MANRTKTFPYFIQNFTQNVRSVTWIKHGIFRTMSMGLRFRVMGKSKTVVQSADRTRSKFVVLPCPSGRRGVESVDIGCAKNTRYPLHNNKQTHVQLLLAAAAQTTLVY